MHIIMHMHTLEYTHKHTNTQPECNKKPIGTLGENRFFFLYCGHSIQNPITNLGSWVSLRAVDQRLIKIRSMLRSSDSQEKILEAGGTED